MELTVLGAIGFFKQFLAVIFIIVSLLLIILVLLQKGRGGGLASAFGGSGGQSAFGSKTGDAFTKITIGFVAVFLVLAVIISKYYTPTATIQEVTISQPSGDQALTPQVDDVAPEAAPAEEVAPAEVETEAAAETPAEVPAETATPAEDN